MTLDDCYECGLYETDECLTCPHTPTPTTETTDHSDFMMPWERDSSRVLARSLGWPHLHSLITIPTKAQATKKEKRDR